MSGGANPLQLSGTVKAAVMHLWAERILILENAGFSWLSQWALGVGFFNNDC